MLDYGLKRADYIDAFFKNINWEVVEARLDQYNCAEPEDVDPAAEF